MLLCSFFSGELQAQSLGITPAFLETKVKRGATHTAAFSISNNTNARVRFHTSTGDYWYDEQNRRLTGPAGTLPRSASNWVQFVPTEFVVEAMSSVTVKAIITIPESANGSYYTMPIFEGEAAEAPVSQKEGSLAASVVVRFCGLLMLTTED